MFHDSLVREINLHLKRAEGEPLPPPPEEGLMEQAPMAPPAPPPSFPDALSALLQAKYGVLLAYVAYGDQLQCFERDGIYKHFQEHIDDERQWIYALHRTLVASGGACYPTNVSIPTPPLQAPRPAIEALLALETQLLDTWDSALAVLHAAPPATQGELRALEAFLQEGARIDLAHVQDLRRYLGTV